MSNEMDASLTTREVARLLNIHVYTVYGLLNGGELLGYKIRTHWRVRRSVLEAFMNPKAKRKAKVGNA